MHGGIDRSLLVTTIWIICGVSGLLGFLLFKMGEGFALGIGFAIIVVIGIGTAGLITVVVSHVIRHSSMTHAQFQIDRASADWARYVYQVGPHTIVRNPWTQEITVHHATVITENRQYPLLEAPKKEPDATEMILTMWDSNSSAREIERHINKGRVGESKISYYQITKVLDLYRSGWNEKHKKAIDVEYHDADD